MSGLAPPTPYQWQVGDIGSASLLNAQLYNGLTYLLNRPIFYGYQGSAQSLTSSTAAPMAIDTTVVDTYGGHSNSTNNSRYVGQAPGYYKVWGSFAGGGLTSQTELVIYAAKNGTEQIGSRTTSASSSAHVFVSTSSPVFIFLNGTTDYVEMYILSDVAGSTRTGTPASAMCVEWSHA